MALLKPLKRTTFESPSQEIPLFEVSYRDKDKWLQKIDRRMMFISCISTQFQKSINKYS